MTEYIPGKRQVKGNQTFRGGKHGIWLSNKNLLKLLSKIRYLRSSLSLSGVSQEQLKEEQRHQYLMES